MAWLGAVIGAVMGYGLAEAIGWYAQAWLFAATGALGLGVAASHFSRGGRSDAEVLPALERRIGTLEREVARLAGVSETREQPQVGEAPGVPLASVGAQVAPAAPDARAAHPAAERRPAVPSSLLARKRRGESPAPPALDSEARGEAASRVESAPARGDDARQGGLARRASPPAESSWLWRTLFGGNILAKVGVAMLFFGVASGLRLAFEAGFFPPAVRLLLAAAAGIAMLVFGYSRVADPRHRVFGLALQGGGFALLYLVTYFAMARHGLVDHGLAFAIFAALGAACMVLAARQDGELLAVMGLAGAFLAPLLATTGKGSPLILFSYYLVLDVAALATEWVKRWRLPGVVGFAFTFGIGMIWVHAAFEPQHFLTVQAFLVGYIALFSAAPVLQATARGRGLDGWADAAVVFGTPTAAVLAQSWLLHESGYGDRALAASALGAGLWYTALWLLLRLRCPGNRLGPAHAAIALSLYTVAVPFALGARGTAAFWALEGLALVWYGLTSRSRVALLFGYPLQLLAGLYFLVHVDDIPRVEPLFNGVFLGGCVLAGSSAACAWLACGRGGGIPGNGSAMRRLAAASACWAVLWWLGTAFSEIDRHASPFLASALATGALLAVAAAATFAGERLDAPTARVAGVAAAAAALGFGVLQSFEGPARHPLHEAMVFALPAAYALYSVLLRRLEALPLPEAHASCIGPAHVGGLWVLAATATLEATWMARELAPWTTAARQLAWVAAPALVGLAALALHRAGRWPVVAATPAYLRIALPVLAAWSTLWALALNAWHPGGVAGLAYLPVLSFFDASQVLVMGFALAWLRAARPFVDPVFVRIGRRAVLLHAFAWVSAMALRVAHHWGGVAWNLPALARSGVAQSLLSFVWTAIALGLMIHATRSGSRRRWFAGFALLGVVGAKFVLVDFANKGTVTWTLSLIGVGLLILAASYFAPAPPRPEAGPPAGSRPAGEGTSP